MAEMKTLMAPNSTILAFKPIEGSRRGKKGDAEIDLDSIDMKTSEGQVDDVNRDNWSSIRQPHIGFTEHSSAGHFHNTLYIF